MIDYNHQFAPYINDTNAMHEKIAALDCHSLSQQEVEEWETEVKKVYGQFINFTKNNQESLQNLSLQKDEESIVLINNLYGCFMILNQDLEALQLTLMFKGRGVNHPIHSYMEKYPLADRVLILGCGHLPVHHLHEGAYCLDSSDTIMPDAQINITTPLMQYLPSGSFPKVILENLPTTIFNKDKWKGVFNQLHRILAADKNQIEFNGMFGMDMKNDFGNIFNLVMPENFDLNSFMGKRIQDSPDLCQKYNEKLKNCFASVGFQFSEDFDMATMPKHYVIYKMDAQ